MAANDVSISLVSTCTILTLIISAVRPEEVLPTLAKTGPAPRPYYPRNYTHFNYTINHPDLCRRPEGDSVEQPLLLMVMVFSAVSHFDSREAIRQTWGTISNRADVQLAFLLGATGDAQEQDRVVKEDALYGDLLQEDFEDTYRNLTLKSIMMLKWVNTTCRPLPRFVLKIDDDCFLNPPHAFQFLQDTLEQESGDAIYGYTFATDPKPQRNKKSKWYLSEEEYPPKKFPVFTSGPSYFWTGGAVPRLYDAVFHTTLVSLEDVYVNGVCAQFANVPNVFVDGISRSMEPRACKIDKHVTFHDLSSEKISMFWWIINDSRFSDHCYRERLPDYRAREVLSNIIKNNIS